ncbi:hypothetical protein AWR36_010480 [Microbulbifer flavimaris]|uniref:Uncharacterized protein n=1 Tax=Microbulbifer flavimaris TaxID=1781068 RepID=A0ABX4HYC6_9GAMM|nr:MULTISPECIES: hypothetical protein [Microbulbifer]KUJ82960.1 hypothetical protein AVO43_10455 [Microbulbifer sp. ZGT114]PCO05145.1 hypothetical protein AWR36_010480 [Microbulbifer flavimaris]
MSSNPFASFNLEIPKKYRDSVLSFSQTSGTKASAEYAPFKRQVDFWYLAFLIGIAKELDPEDEADTYNAISGTIFGSDPHRIAHMQIAYLGRTGSVEGLAEHRKVFDFCLGVANAAMPVLLAILSEPDERPLWSLLDELENLM